MQRASSAVNVVRKISRLRVDILETFKRCQTAYALMSLLITLMHENGLFSECTGVICHDSCDVIVMCNEIIFLVPFIGVPWCHRHVNV